MDPLAYLQQTKVQPRPYQQRIVARVVDLFTTKEIRSILIESPTGSGKTIMGLLVARALQIQLGLRVGWVSMRRYLLAQAETENREKAIGVEATYLSMFDRDPPTGLDLLVVDEAQHDAAQSMAHLHQRIQPRFILGLSATPFRADRVKLCFDTVIKDAGIQALIQDGYLSNYHHYTIPRYTPAEVAEFYLRDRPRWGRSLFYFHTLRQCHEADSLLRKAGIRSEVVSANSERDAQLEAFRRGEVEVLSNCMVLSEGFDCPELRTVFCRPSCKGVTVQMGGRVLRKHPDVPIKQIVQCGRSPWPFPRTATPAVQYIWQDGGWRSLQGNPLIHQVNGHTLKALARIQVEMPKFITQQPQKRQSQRRHARQTDFSTADLG